MLDSHYLITVYDCSQKIFKLNELTSDLTENIFVHYCTVRQCWPIGKFS